MFGVWRQVSLSTWCFRRSGSHPLPLFTLTCSARQRSDCRMLIWGLLWNKDLVVGQHRQRYPCRCRRSSDLTCKWVLLNSFSEHWVGRLPNFTPINIHVNPAWFLFFLRQLFDCRMQGLSMKSIGFQAYEQRILNGSDLSSFDSEPIAEECAEEEEMQNYNVLEWCGSYNGLQIPTISILSGGLRLKWVENRVDNFFLRNNPNLKGIRSFNLDLQQNSSFW